MKKITKCDGKFVTAVGPSDFHITPVGSSDVDFLRCPRLPGRQCFPVSVGSPDTVSELPT